MLTILKQILIILAGIGVVIGWVCLLVLEVGHEKRKRQFWGSAPLQYQLLYLVLIFAVVAAVWFGHQLWDRWYYETGPRPYASAEAAAADGCLVIQASGQPLDGQEHWEAFLTRTRAFQDATVKIALQDGGAVQSVNQLHYDGLRYHYTINPPYIHQPSETESYPFLLHLSHTPPPDQPALYAHREFWVLTDKPDLTGQELANRLYTREPDYQARVLITVSQ